MCYVCATYEYSFTHCVHTVTLSLHHNRGHERHDASSTRQSPFILPLCTQASPRLMRVTTHSNIYVAGHVISARSKKVVFFFFLFFFEEPRGQTLSVHIWHTSVEERSRNMCVPACVYTCVCVYHCPSASADPPARVSRARSKFSPPLVAGLYTLLEFPPRRVVVVLLQRKESFFYPERTGQPAAAKWGEKRFRWISNRGGIRVGQSARLIGLDESTSTKDVPRISSAAVSKPFSRTWKGFEDEGGRLEEGGGRMAWRRVLQNTDKAHRHAII